MVDSFITEFTCLDSPSFLKSKVLFKMLRIVVLDSGLRWTTSPSFLGNCWRVKGNSLKFAIKFYHSSKSFLWSSISCYQVTLLYTSLKSTVSLKRSVWINYHAKTGLATAQWEEGQANFLQYWLHVQGCICFFSPSKPIPFKSLF